MQKKQAKKPVSMATPLAQQVCSLTDLLASKASLHASPLANASKNASKGLDANFWLTLMAHELLTPVQSTQSLLELTLSSDLQPAQQHWLSLAADATQQMRTFLHTIVACVESQDGSVKLPNANTEAFELRAFLVTLCQQYRQAAKAKGLHILLKVEPTLPNYWCGQPGLLRHCLANLISNAIKFTSQGYIRVKVALKQKTKQATKQATLPTQGAVATLCFTVEDTGCGFGLPNSAFSTIGQSLTPLLAPVQGGFSSTGLGLGLYLVNTLTQALGGQVHVSSQLGQGSAFTLELPLTLQQGEQEASLKGLSMVFLTPNDCSCTNDHEQVLDTMGLKRDVVVYPKYPPAPAKLSPLLEQDDFIYLCTQHLSTKEAFDWLEDPALHVQGKALLVVSGVEQDFTERFEAFRSSYPAPCLLITSSLDFAPAFTSILQWKHQLQEQAKPERLASASALGTIILVENNPVQRLITEASLKRFGQNVLVCPSVTEALQVVQSHPAEVVLTDLFLEDGEGIELARQIRRLESNQRLPHNQRPLFIAALTACQSKMEEHWALQAGMNAYFTKPLELDLLNQAFYQHQVVPASVSVISAVGASKAEPLPACSTPPNIRFSVEPLLHRLNNKPELLQEVLQAFLEDVPIHLQVMRQALQQQDRLLLAKEAHQLKGSFAYVQALPLKELANHIEQMAPVASIKDLNALVLQLNQAFERLQGELQEALKPVSAF